MTYQSIVHISNEIRFVLNTSRQVNLAAQNASLAARRAGNARGFQAVSSELKTFSQGLGTAMSGMASDIQDIAHSVSGTYRQQRIYRHQQAAFKDCGEVALLATSLSRTESRQKGMRSELGKRLRHLDSRLGRAQRVCANGRALARAALIEASNGGAAEGILRNVAHDIERTIEDIHGRLKTINVHLRAEMENA